MRIEATDWRTLIIAGAVRRRRLSDADLLRSVRAAHDRPHRSAVSRRGAGRLHQLCGRPQCRRQRVFRRRGALPHLFGLGPERHRGHQNLFRRRADILARQRHRARARRSLCAASGARHRSIAAVGQPHAGARDPRHARRLCRVGLGQAARDRPRRLAGDAARRPADARCRSPSASSISAAAPPPCTCWCRTSPISASSRWR